MQKVGVFREPLGKQQEREERGAPGLRLSRIYLRFGVLRPNPLCSLSLLAPEHTAATCSEQCRLVVTYLIQGSCHCDFTAGFLRCMYI